MNRPEDSGQSSADIQAGGFTFPLTPPSSFGPETIINPERRGVISSSESLAALPRSDVWNRLFPAETADGRQSWSGAVGVRLGHFEITGHIGLGGMGAVFQAVDQRLKRTVALKVLSPGQCRDQAVVQRFENEARAAAQLDHDNIARVFYFGEDQGLYFIAYEFIPGTNLRDVIRERGPLGPAEAVNYTLQIASALHHMSRAGVVHRDIKPSNIILSPNGRAKLVDLGLARKQATESVGELTMAGTTLGTFDYISPEQAKDPRNVDVRTDIYSLGCTLYHMLTGEPPYPEGTVLQKLLDHQGKEPPDPAKKNRQVPPALSAIVRRMMAGDLQQRYTTPDELIHDLLLISGPMGLRAGNPDGLIWTGTSEARRGFWERHLGWMVTTAALVLIVLFIGRFQEPPRTNIIDDNTTGGVASADSPGNRQRIGSGGGQPSLRQGGATEVTPTVPAKDPSDATGSAGREGPIGGSSSAPATPTGTDGSTTAHVPDGGSLYQPHDPDAVVSGNPAIRPSSGSGTGTDATTTGSKAPVALPVPAPRPTATMGTQIAGKTDPVTSPPPTAAASRAIVIVGDESNSFPTLEGACRAARDNTIIELRYNGRRSGPAEKPIRIENKKITIRAGKDADGNLYRPLIVFAPPQDAASAPRMISLIGGSSIELFNLDVLLTIPDDLEPDGGDRWSLLSLHGTEQVSMQGVTVTIVDAGSQPVSIVELAGGRGRDLSKMKMMKKGSSEGPGKFRVRISQSAIRGRCDLFVAAHNQPGVFNVEKSVVAIDGSLLSLLGDLDMPGGNSEVELLLAHVTCLTDGGLLRFDSGDQPRQLIPVHVTAANSIFLTATNTPLVTMTGDTDASDFRRLLHWGGSKNFYTGIRTFWSVESTAMTTETQRLDFQEWKRFVGAKTEADAHQGGVVWKRDGNWRMIRKDQLTAADLQLDTAADATMNPAATGAADGTAAGADITALPHFPPRPESLDNN